MLNNKDFYPTPLSLIHKMLSGIKLDQITTILEPSAGKGDIIDAIVNKNKSYSSKFRGPNLLDIDTIEIDTNLQHILKGKNYKVVYNDFLKFQTYKSYDLIIQNPPFSEGDKHLLKALEMQQNGGQIICLLNAETLKNPHTNQRKDLNRKLNDYNAEITYIQNAFRDAERQTPVEIALIKVAIPKAEKVSTIINNLKKEEYHEKPINNENKLISSDFLEGIVAQYDLEIKAGLTLINEYEAMIPYILKSYEKKDASPIISLKVEGVDKYDHETRNNYIKKVRYKYWQALFVSDAFSSLFTSNLRNEYFDKIRDLQNYDFSLYNIQQIKLEILKSMNHSIEQTIFNLFEDLSNKHHYAEYSKNIHYYDGWKTNKAWKINHRVIIPMYGVFGNYSWDKFKPTGYRAFEKLSDIEKVLNYLDDGSTEPILLESSLESAEQTCQTRKIETKHFYITFYKKGTCHLEFKDLSLLHKFNIFGSQRKAWLPPSYGKKPYNEMTIEEQEVINEFEGETSYNKTFANKDYYITTSFNSLMIAG